MHASHAAVLHAALPVVSLKEIHSINASLSTPGGVQTYSITQCWGITSSVAGSTGAQYKASGFHCDRPGSSSL